MCANGGAANPALTGKLELRDAINLAFGLNNVPMVVEQPQSATFANQPLTTSNFSAIAIGSDWTCGGCDLNFVGNCGAAAIPPCLQDSDAIEARIHDIVAFFDAGGGLYVGAGADAGDGHAGDHYYDFVASAGGAETTGPFSLTSLGQALGLTDGDINCSCGTHNSFRFPPAGSRLKSAERDPAGNNVTLIEDSEAPRTAITSGPPSLTGSTSATFTFQPSENLTSFACSLDGAMFGTCSSPATFTGLAEGRHQLSVRATDLVGNVEVTPPSYSWTVAFDRDGDGFTRFSPQADCNDNNRKIHPGATEIRGNKVDENCDGVASPFLRIRTGVRFFFNSHPSFTTVTTLNLTHVPSNARVKVACRGGGCPFHSKSVRRPHRTVHLASSFHNAHLRPGAKIELAVSRSGSIGKLERFTVRRSELPKFADLCVQPGSKPARTCSLYKGG
jgi:Putative metal-binding motif